MKIVSILILLILPSLSFAQKRLCGASSLWESNLHQNPNLLDQQQTIERYTKNWIATHTASQRDIITIPIVVHVVWKNATDNISEEQILSQITVLNQDFRKMNTDLESNVPNSFLAFAADTEIEFCLATKDPAGNSTNGITRTHTDVSFIGSNQQVHYSNLGGKNGWSPEDYLNIWVARIDTEHGRATAPGTAMTPEEDGVVIDPSVFGTTGLAANNAPFHLGRTATHEIGHYLNLMHIWGSGNGGDCSVDDEVADTPKQITWYTACPDPQAFTCSSKDMFMNYMDYVDDDCMGLFTHGQKARMLAALAGPRNSLLSSEGCDSLVGNHELSKAYFTLYPNPTTGPLFIHFKNTLQNQKWTYQLTDLKGETLRMGILKNKSIQEIDITGLSSGLYFLHLKHQTGNFIQKIIIIP